LTALLTAILLSIAPSSGRIEDEFSWVGKPAPEIAAGQWLNSAPLRIAELRGKVVLVEFWAFGCWNCRNTIPSMKSWFGKFRGNEFVMIGIHTPELDREKKFEALKAEVRQLGVSYPVVTDNDYKTWNAYHQQYWPVIYLIDKRGVIRYVRIGEGQYDVTENEIAALLAEK